MVSYASWPLEKLKKEVAKIEKAIKEKETKQKKEVIAELKSIARKHGFALSELINQAEFKANSQNYYREVVGETTSKASDSSILSKPTKRRAKAKVKYRNPHNRGETWTGRGRRPRWVANYLDSGGKMDDLSI